MAASKSTTRPKSPGPARARSCPVRPFSAPPTTRARSRPCARRSKSAPNQPKVRRPTVRSRLFVVLVIVVIIIVARFGTRVLGGGGVVRRTRFDRYDQRPRLDLRTRIEHDDGLSG